MLRATLDLVRSNPAAAVVRIEVARAAGVTPALVCYYYAEHTDLIEAALRPVVDEYRRLLVTILDNDDDDDTKLRNVVILLIRAHLRDQNVVDQYVDIVRHKRDPSDMGHLLEGYNSLVKFIEQGRFTILTPGVEPRFLVFALWGMCRGVARDSALPIEMWSGEARTAETLADMVLRVIGVPIVA